MLAIVYQEWGNKTGIMLCHQTSGSVTGWGYKRDSL